MYFILSEALSQCFPRFNETVRWILLAIIIDENGLKDY